MLLLKTQVFDSSNLKLGFLFCFNGVWVFFAEDLSLQDCSQHRWWEPLDLQLVSSACLHSSQLIWPSQYASVFYTSTKNLILHSSCYIFNFFNDWPLGGKASWECSGICTWLSRTLNEGKFSPRIALYHKSYGKNYTTCFVLYTAKGQCGFTH